MSLFSDHHLFLKFEERAGCSWERSVSLIRNSPSREAPGAPQATANKTMACSIQQLGPGKSRPLTLLIKWQPLVEEHGTTRKTCEADWVGPSLSHFSEDHQGRPTFQQSCQTSVDKLLLPVPGSPQLGQWRGDWMEKCPGETHMVLPTSFTVLDAGPVLRPSSAEPGHGKGPDSASLADSWTWRRQQPPLLHSLSDINKELAMTLPARGYSLSYTFPERQQQKARWLRPGLWSQAARVWTPNWASDWPSM